MTNNSRPALLRLAPIFGSGFVIPRQQACECTIVKFL